MAQGLHLSQRLTQSLVLAPQLQLGAANQPLRLLCQRRGENQDVCTPEGSGQMFESMDLRGVIGLASWRRIPTPFKTLDQSGVGTLVRWACERGRAKRPDLHLGICGEHGGDPRSVPFCAAVGLDYVSCSPYRVPIARLAAAQAALKKRGVKERQGEA